MNRCAGLILLTLVVTSFVSLGRPALADTHGNTDSYEGTLDPNPSTSPKQVSSSWWSGSTVAATQRYGCTLETVELDAAPSFCPYPYNAGWHQGIDIGLGSGTTLYSRVTGTVAAAVTSCLLSGCALGYLAIKTSGDGRIVYLLHGSPNANFTQVGAPVNVGDPVYTTGSNGLSFGAHLHFEVHNSVVGELSVGVGPGDDINPELWLSGWGGTSMEAMAAMDSSGNQAFYAFVPRPVDGHLKLNFYSVSTGWTWFDESSPAVSANPPSVALGGRVAQISFIDGGGVLRQYAFVSGSNDHLYADFYSNTGWRWTDQSLLTGAPAFVREVVGAGTFIDNQGAHDLYVFVIDTLGALWLNFGNASTGAPQNWQNLSTLATPYPAGSPPPPSLSAGVGAVAGVTTTGRALYAFAQGSNGHPYLFFWGDQTHWSVVDEHIETPFPGVTVTGRVGVDSFVDDSSISRVYAFVIGNLGRVYVNYYDGTGATGWHWGDLGLLNAQGTTASVGVGVTHFRKSDRSLNVFAAAIGADNSVYVVYGGLYPSAWYATPAYPGLTPFTDAGTTAYVSPANGSQGLYLMTTATVAWSNVERDLQLDLWSSANPNQWQALDQGSL